MSAGISTVDDLNAITSAYDDILAHSTDAHPREAVGIVWEDGRTFRLINQNPATGHFWVAKRQLVDMFSINELHPVALYHTHPTTPAVPSDLDRTLMEQMHGHALWGGTWTVILGTDGLRVWWWDQASRAPQEVSL